MPPRTRGGAANADADEIVIDDSPERPSKRTKPVQWRHRGVKSKDTCVFPGCNTPVDRGVSSHSAYPLFTEPVDARCCDRCNPRVVVDRAARTHPVFPLRECMHPADPGHSCAFTQFCRTGRNGSNMEKWRSWAIGPESMGSSKYGTRDEDLTFKAATSVLTKLIGKSGCLECAHQFLWRCKIMMENTYKSNDSYTEACVSMIARILLDHSTSEVRPAAVKAVFDDWWGSSSKLDLQSFFNGRAELVTKLFWVIPESSPVYGETFFKFIGALSEARVQWWSPVIWSFRETGDAWKCFQIMLKDMNRELKLSKDSAEMKSMYVKDIAAILTPWLVRGDHADVQRFIESKGIKLRGKSVLGDVADEINLPSLIRDICTGDVEANLYINPFNGDQALNSNIKWFASLYRPSRGSRRLKWTRSCWSTQQVLFECRGDAPDELILDAMELLMKHFRPYAVNPCVFGRAILRALEEDQQLGFGNKLILLFLKFADTRLLCTWPSTQNEVREYFGDDISHVSVELFTDQTTSHKEFFSLMSHVFVNACLANRDDGDSDWRGDWSQNDLFRMLHLRPSDFAQEVREHENFWLRDDDATRTDKRAALQLAQSSIDKVKERMPDGIYKEVMDDLMTQWNDA